MTAIIKNSLLEAQTALNRLLADEVGLSNIEAAANLLIQTLQNGGRVYSCGNGGSMCDAMHFAEELTGRYRKNRRGFAAMAISDPGHMSCVANDFGYEQVYAKALELQAGPKDGVVAISSSGNSPNIINAVASARRIGCWVTTLTGFKASNALRPLGDLNFHIESDNYGTVEVGHLILLHGLLDLSMGWASGTIAASVKLKEH